jgi:CRISPR system Cascade subunit CasD
VIGLLAAAQGRRRTDPIEDLLGLRFGVRVDESGELLEDFHTVSRLSRELPKAEGGMLKGEAANKVTYRQYLQDAVFVAGLEGDDGLLTSLDEALRSPAFPLFLGRRSCPPLPPVTLGLHEGSIEEVLGSLPWLASDQRQRRLRDDEVSVELIVDDPEGEPHPPDVPRSFDPFRRSFGVRAVRRSVLHVPVLNSANSAKAPDRSHDPFSLL